MRRQDVDLVQRKLTDDMGNPLGAAYIKLLYDDPSGKKQIVRLHIWDDDYDFYYIYRWMAMSCAHCSMVI